MAWKVQIKNELKDKEKINNLKVVKHLGVIIIKV